MIDYDFLGSHGIIERATDSFTVLVDGLRSLEIKREVRNRHVAYLARIGYRLDVSIAHAVRSPITFRTPSKSFEDAAIIISRLKIIRAEAVPINS